VDVTRAGINEREAPGKFVTACPPKRLAQLSSVSQTLVLTLQNHQSKLIRFGSLTSETIGGDHVRRFVCG